MIIILLLFNLYYVDQPCAKIPGHGVFAVQLRFGPGGEILGFFDVGIWDRLGLGISYGASNLIGAGDPEFYKQPGAQIRVLAVEEDIIVPAVILGFDNQGFGPFNDSTERYMIMSKGIYCETGKTFASANISFTPSVGVNYSFEENSHWDMFAAANTVFGSSASFLLEYSPNFNDPLDRNRGYMNVGLRIIFYEQLFFEFDLRDLLNNSIPDQKLNRTIKMGYEQQF